MTEPINITVIIPTLNAAGSLEDLVHALRSQILQPDQILVVDSGSTDETVALVRKLGLDLLNVEADSFDHGRTRNLAAARARGNIIVFMTQDCLPLNSETLLNLVRPLQEKEIIVSYARQVADDAARPGEKYLRLINYPPERQLRALVDLATYGITTFQNSNVCAAYQRREFEALGRFPEPAVCNEDMIFAARAIFTGYKVSYTADALVLHTHHYKAVDLFKRYFDISASLDLEPAIKKNGRLEQKGYQFFKSQLQYLKKEGRLSQTPLVMLETTARFAGFKAGANHNLLPRWLKTRLGANKLYWSKYG